MQTPLQKKKVVIRCKVNKIVLLFVYYIQTIY